MNEVIENDKTKVCGKNNNRKRRRRGRLMERRYNVWAGNPKGDAEYPERCIEEIYDPHGWHSYQCARRRGFGKDNLYCKRPTNFMSRRINKEKLNNDLYAIADKLRKTDLNSSLCNDLQLLAGKISEDGYRGEKK